MLISEMFGRNQQLWEKGDVVLSVKLSGPAKIPKKAYRSLGLFGVLTASAPANAKHSRFFPCGSAAAG